MLRFFASISAAIASVIVYALLFVVAGIACLLALAGALSCAAALVVMTGANRARLWWERP